MNSTTTSYAHLATIIAIGTEITSGDIANTNAAWISRKLSDLGIGTERHIAVPDDRKTILETLSLGSSSSYIFITGGLGPTSDDLTRDLIAEWMQTDLVFAEESWTRLNNLLSQRGVAVAQSNRKQCYFPKKSVILRNRIGTADGFRCVFKNSKIFALPGPPRELQAIWEDHIQAELEGVVPHDVRPILHVWQCIGESESRLAERVEEVLGNSGLTIGYRARVPYVDLKLWGLKSEFERCSDNIQRLESMLREFLVAKDREDVHDLLLSTLTPNRPIQIVDLATAGRFTERCQEVLKKDIYSSIRTCISFISMFTPVPNAIDAAMDLLKQCPADTAIIVTGIDAGGRWSLACRANGKTHIQTHSCRLKGEAALDRNQKAIAELAALYASKILKNSSGES